MCYIILRGETRRNRSATIRFFQLCASYQEYRNLAYEIIYIESMLTWYRVGDVFSIEEREFFSFVSDSGSRKTCEIRAKPRLSPFFFIKSGNISLSRITPIANRSWDKYTREPSFFLFLLLSLPLSLFLSRVAYLQAYKTYAHQYTQAYLFYINIIIENPRQLL